jgi:tetratricopeptide (TPR) repeat protein
LKNYISGQKYDLAKEIIQFATFDSTLQDSVALQKLVLFRKTKDWSNAVDSVLDILSSSKNDSLQHAVLPAFENLLSHLSPASVIDKITTLIKQTNNNSISQYALLLLGEVYERNHLFYEAKDVYFVILADSTFVDTISIYLKIIRSELYLQEFDEALQTIQSLIIKPDNIHVAEIQFLHFIAHYSTGNLQAAKEILLDLYLKYPEHPNRNEIIEALAVIYFEKKQYLMSWYFWEQLYELSSAYKKIAILKTFDEVKDSLVRDSLAIEQFKFFKPVFEFPDEKK